MITALPLNSELKLEEARERYREVQQEFERVKDSYSGLSAIFRRNLRTEDQKSLDACVATLLRLENMPSVQEQAKVARKEMGNMRGTLYFQIEALDFQIFDYLSEFRNSGVIRGNVIW